MIDLQDIITTKRELLSRATCSLSPINYSAGMAEDQKERYIQYLAEQNQDLRLTSDAMKLVLEDFMAQMKDLKDQVSERLNKTAKELYGIDNFCDMVGDETIATDPETLLAFLTEKGHPALGMDPMM